MATRAEEAFKEELALIKDERVKAFTVEVLNEFTPEYFWTAPASSTGKYHPAYSLGEGGVLRHVKIVAWMASQFTAAIPLSREEIMNSNMGKQLYTDVVVAGAILHDLEKFGPNFDGTPSSLPKDNTACHGITFANKIYAAKFKSGETPPFAIRCVLRGIAGHMGPWTGDDRYKPDYQKDPVIRKVCRCIFYGDYAASRRYPDYILELMKQGDANVD